ncbi:MAG: preprotein translocase subunit SecG [Rhodospirillaceae bacterium]|nr:preprotein translocase subunit SecG [Rhodospirillaceae bacterium]MEA4839015.1 preprotein translocase subunit SecG [Rhodospirillaceae bacterium]
MLYTVLVIHLLIAIAMVAVILLQRSEGGALGIGGGGGGLMSGRAAGNLLTRSTAILATLFFVTSLGLAIMGNPNAQKGSIMEGVDTVPAEQTPVSGTPSAPSAPMSR